MYKGVLAPLALIYGCIVSIRHKLFDWGILRSKEYDIPIVCVGNITVGGTGKTPVAEFLIEYLSRDYNVALLSRGYGRRTKGYREVNVDSSFLDVGDEPKQIKLKYSEVVVAVCEKRVEGIDTIRELHPEVNLIILDDGFQHRYVEPWINIVLMEYSRPIYRDHLLPWGSLRDTTSQMYRANYVLITKCPDNISPIDMRLVGKYLGLYPYQSMHFTRMESTEAIPLFADVAPTPVATPGVSVVAMSGIGNPESFHRAVSARYNLVGKLTFPDHHPYRSRDLDKMLRALESAPDDAIIVTTEKDAVKLTNRRKIPVELQRKIYFTPIKLSFTDESEKDFINQLEYDVRTNPKYSLLH